MSASRPLCPGNLPISSPNLAAQAARTMQYKLWGGFGPLGACRGRLAFGLAVLGYRLGTTNGRPQRLRQGTPADLGETESLGFFRCPDAGAAGGH